MRDLDLAIIRAACSSSRAILTRTVITVRKSIFTTTERDHYTSTVKNVYIEIQKGLNYGE